MRPATEEEAREGPSARKALRLRQEAEALLNLGDRVSTPESRQQHGARWAPLVLALDKRLSEVLHTCPDEDESFWDGDNSCLHSSVSSVLGWER